MGNAIEVRVPDIGGHSDVPVIELLVAVGDTVAKDQGLVTLESDKATMEVPSPAAGVITALKVKLGDTVSEGAVIAMLEAEGEAGGAAAAAPAKAPSEPAAAPRLPAAAAGRAVDARATGRRRLGPQRRHHLCTGRAGRRSRRLHRRIPRRRPWPRHRADRALCLARRRLPQCRLHPVEGVAACGRCHRPGCACERLWRGFRQAQDQPRQAARLQGKSGRPADQGPGRHGQAAQGAGGAGHRDVRVGQRTGNHRCRWQGATAALRQLRHRRRFAAGEAAGLPVGRPAGDGFHRCAGIGRSAEEAAGGRRRHHRAGDGHGLSRAGRRSDGGRIHAATDAWRRPRPGQAAGRSPQEAGCRRAPEDQGGRGQGAEERHRLHVRRRQHPRGETLRSRAGGGGSQRQRRQAGCRQGRRARG